MASTQLRYEVSKGKQSDRSYSLQFLAGEYQKGAVNGKTRVWCKGMSNWTAIDKCHAQPWYPHLKQILQSAKVPGKVLTLRYEVKKGQQSDPTEISKLAALLSDPSSGVTDQTRVWAVGMASWTQLSKCTNQPWFEQLQAEAMNIQTTSPDTSPTKPTADAADAVRQLEPEPEPQADGERPKPKSALAATAEGEPEPGSQIHVRGVGKQFEDEAALKDVFAKFGSVVQATVRHRIDKDTGANTSWALVTMESKDGAEAVMAGAQTLPSPLTVTRFSKQIADSSTGQMGRVRREAAAKMIQSRWRQQLGFREAMERSMDFGGDWDEHLAASQVDPAASVQSQRVLEPATAEGEPEPGSQIHVRGVGKQFEDEAALKDVFAKFGSVVQATVRHRIDKDTGANTSWALVTMESKDGAEAVMAGAQTLPSPLTVTRFSKQIADSSTGQMGRVRREAAAKMIQSRWRQQLGFREAMERSMDFGGDWDEHLAASQVDPAASVQSQRVLEPEPEPQVVRQNPIEDANAADLQKSLRQQEALTTKAIAEVHTLSAALETARAETASIQAALDAEKAAHIRTRQQLELEQSSHKQVLAMHEKRSTSAEGGKNIATEEAEIARTKAAAAEAAKAKTSAEMDQLRKELQAKLKQSLAQEEHLKQQLDQDANASRAAIEKAEAAAAAAVQQVAAEAAHTAELARDLRECRAELARTRSDKPHAGEEGTDSDKLAAALAGESAAKEHNAILQKTLDASVELCKRAEASWEARHEEHCKEMEALRAKVTAFINGEESPLSTDADGDHGGESRVEKRDSASEELRKGDSAAASEHGQAEEGIPPSVPMSAALPYGHDVRAIDAAGGSTLSATLSAQESQFGLSPVSTASSLPYNSTAAGAARSGAGFDGLPDRATSIGAPPASPMSTRTGASVSTAHSRSSSSSKTGKMYAL